MGFSGFGLPGVGQEPRVLVSVTVIVTVTYETTGEELGLVDLLDLVEVGTGGDELGLRLGIRITGEETGPLGIGATEEELIPLGTVEEEGTQLIGDSWALRKVRITVNVTYFRFKWLS